MFAFFLELGYDAVAIRERWTGEYFRMMQRAIGRRRMRAHAAQSGGGASEATGPTRRVSGDEMLRMIGGGGE